MMVKNLNGRIKGSNFSLGDADLNWGKAPVIRIRSGQAGVNLNEIYPWLATQKSLVKSLEDIKAITGSVKLSQLALSGPLNSPSNWNYQLAGKLENIHIKSDLLPAPLSVDRATFKATPDVLTLSGAKTHIMDASMTVSGRFTGYREGLNQADIDFQGLIGKKGDQWLMKTIHLPSQLILRPPLSVANGRFSWDKNGRTAFSGDLTIHNDLNLSADVVLEPHTINVKKFVIKDKVSQATVVLNYREKKDITFGFKGNLQKSTVDKLLSDNKNIYGWIKGDLRLEYFKNHPMDSRFEGNLSASDLVLLRHFNIPVKVKTLSIRGIKDKFHIEADMLSHQDQHLKLNGDVNYSSKGIIFDTDLYSSGITLDNLLAALGKNKKTDHDVQKKTFWEFPAEGVVRLDSEYVTYGKYTWRPLRATVELHPEKIDISISDAAICGISTSGTLILSPGEIEFDVTPAAKNQDVHATVTCLLDKTAKFDGKFDLTGKIRGQGPPENLVNSLSGNFEFNAANGTIYSGRALRSVREILRLVNTNEIEKGHVQELQKDGYVYNSLKTKASIKNNTIVVEEGVIDGLAIGIVYNGALSLTDKKINITALVALLKTVDSFVKKIPVFGHIFGGALTSIPISLKGDLDNPDIRILPPAAVGEGLVGIAERTLKLPVKIFDSFKPEKKD